VKIPALVVQASKDPTVNPESARQIFEQLGSEYKKLVVFERNRHGIINGLGKEDVYDEVIHFLERAPQHETAEVVELEQVAQAAS
jgi:esterase/lipase